MLLTSTLRKLVKLSGLKTKILINEKVEFFVSVTSKDDYNCNLHIENVKGSFTNLRISAIDLNPLPFDPATQTYQANALQLQSPLHFILECEVEYKIVNSVTWAKEFSVSANHLGFLNVFECFEGQISIGNYKFYKLQFYIKKFEAGFIEFTIKNPHNIQINGQRTDFNHIATSVKDLKLNLLFMYDPKVMEILDKKSQDEIQDAEKSVLNTATESENSETSENELLSNKSNVEEDVTKIPSDDTVAEPTPVETSLQNEEKQITESTLEDKPVTANEATTETLHMINSEAVNLTAIDVSVPEDCVTDEHRSPVKDLSKVSEAEYEEESVIREENQDADAKKTTTVKSSNIIEAVTPIVDSILDDTFSEETQIPVNSSKPVTESEFDENTITTENKPTDSNKPATKCQNMISATSYKINDYVILISSDRKRIFSSASLLTRHSYIFATILRKIKKSPVKINMEEFNAETIYAALDFLNGKHDVIIKKEIQLYYFADKYSLRNLKSACCSKFDKILSNKNVCKILQIAYANYFEELKLKCIEIIRTCTQAIHESDINALPPEIYSEIFVEVL